MRKVTTIREFDDYGNCIKEVITDENVKDIVYNEIKLNDFDWNENPSTCDTIKTRTTVPIDTSHCDKIRFGNYENDGTGD